ncbi:PfkB family carbohydrate kinase [Brevibacterium sp.]|uniref:1-phosphofructokinase family hexose kinase n=1 Tax=Brevibacterium sp. TaxID=1701 RepID=UPI0025BAB6C2|nr:PfkB family carbohydrate kinase [Brevibacterium sp.]
MIAAIALSPSLDVTYVVERLHGIQRPLEVVRVAGGKSLNAARVAVMLGADRVAASAVLAGGAGTDIAAHARAQGLHLRIIDGHVPTRTCVSVFDRSSRELTEIYEHAVALDDIEVEHALDAAVEAMGSKRGLYLLSGGLSEDHARRAVRRVRAAGGSIALDTHGTALSGGIEEGPDLVKVNRAEAVALLGYAPDAPPDELVSGLHDRLDSATARAVVTDGADGAWSCDGAQVLHAQMAGPIGGFPVGSGDAFLGGLARAFDAGESLSNALALATGAGVANAQIPGAGLLDPSLAREIAARVEVRPYRASTRR